MTLFHLFSICVLGVFAGLVNAVAGGGGLVQIPALFIFLPGAPAAELFGTNKFSSVCGTLFAFLRYRRHVRMDWAVAGPAGAAALLFASVGARCVTLLPQKDLRPIILALLIVMAAYSATRKDFGSLHAPKLFGRRKSVCAFLMGSATGFYDGFFGPGTGNILMFLLVGVFGYDFLAASATAKWVNAASNLAALAYFAATGHVDYALALPLAACNVVGAQIGTRVAITRGSGFVRGLFLIVVAAVIVKFAADTLH